MEKPTQLALTNRKRSDGYVIKEVEKILNKRTTGTITEYLVKWKVLFSVRNSQLVTFCLFFL